MKKKPFFLFIALVVPVIIFLVLKFFGRNRFDLPIMHQTDLEWPTNCTTPRSFPFTVPDSVITPSGHAMVVLFIMPDQEALLRLPVEIDTTLTSFQWMNIETPGTSPCLFGAPPGSAAVLIDAELRVRGVYEKLSRDETDRLIMETKILNQQY